MRLTAAAPGVALPLPVVCGFHLEPIAEALFEQAVFITDAVAIQREVERRRGIQKAGRETAKAAVAERRVFDILKHGDIQAALFEGVLDLGQNIEHEQIVVNRSANQIFRAEIISFPGALMRVPAFVPTVRNRTHYHTGQSVVQLRGRCVHQRHLMVLLERKFDALHDVVDLHKYEPHFFRIGSKYSIFHAACKGERNCRKKSARSCVNGRSIRFPRLTNCR
ncbi:hypothetical protein SDC9_108079 [bioreactor metagenome]|uniref:Uncharacterized protein n=1 Tax=bioreactor metagenome TaxID=1076179 RepID=A0A645B728_9ZZZZ